MQQKVLKDYLKEWDDHHGATNPEYGPIDFVDSTAERLSSELTTGIKQLTKGYGWDPGELESTTIDVSNMEGFDGIESIQLVGFDPASFNPGEFSSGLEAMEEAGTLSKIFTTATSKSVLGYFGGGAVGAGLGLGLQKAMHNDDQWIILNSAAAMALGPVGAMAAVTSSIITKYGVDYYRRQIAAMENRTDSKLNRVAYIRSGDKWIPAIVTAHAGVRIFGFDWNWNWQRPKLGRGNDPTGENGVRSNHRRRWESCMAEARPTGPDDCTSRRSPMGQRRGDRQNAKMEALGKRIYASKYIRSKGDD